MSLTIVGTGPGTDELLAPMALEALKTADTVIGYKSYIELVKHLIPEGTEVESYGMMQEVERSRMSIGKALSGRSVVILSGGDAGVFSIAGPVLELLTEEQQEELDVRIIPGITSALSSAALLGAPLIHDFSVISLSNLLTPTELIQKRLNLAAEGDFVTVLYNPASKKRTQLIRETRDIYLNHRKPETPVGIIRHGFRADQEVVITTLDKMLDHQIDMNTTVVIGNSQSYVKGRFMITPRGYRIED
ncbi:MAG: precorrin-3B C(17)-methyltransferase [Spirochaetales bacterium]|nr:precorrin-3B C(17)-methyltransferase [Spirochaetales bacterium]